MQEDPNKVAEFLERIKNTDTSEHRESWTIANGFHSLTSLSLNGDRIVLDNTSGIPVKVFINDVTGETRLAAMARLLPDDGPVMLDRKPRDTRLGKANHQKVLG